MKKPSLIVALLITSHLCFGQSEIETQKFSPEELKHDLQFLFEKLESIHPSLYFFTSKQQVSEKRIALEKELDHPMTRLEFAQKVIPIVSSLKDAHTSLAYPSEERTTFLKNSGKVFPLDVLIHENKIFIATNYGADSTILSAEILSINGILSTEVLEKLRSFISAELDFYRDNRVQRAFRRMLWYAYGWEGDYDLQLIANGETVNTKIAGITEKELTASYQKRGVPSVKPFSYYPLESKIGVIDFRSMNNLKKFSDFLDSTFSVIRKNNIQYLVIDIRNNGGGNSQLGNALFDYITDKPYKQAERVEMKVSREMKTNFRRNHLKWYHYPLIPFAVFHPEGRAYIFGTPGKIKVFNQRKLQNPHTEKLKFTGPTYLLTSHSTFSSANMLANTFKCYKMGTIIGEETGGVLTAFGDLIEVKLPNSQLQGWCSHKKFVHPCADDTIHGVKPDVEIVPTLEDIQNRRDPALEYVLKAIKNNK